MYSATCPKCGTTLYSNVRGQAWLACQTCKYFGLLLTTPLPASIAQSQAPAQLAAPSAPLPAASAASAVSGLPDSLLGALQPYARLYGEEIATQLAALTSRDYRLSLTQVWDRMQQATDALFHSLGERRMGDYPPDIESVSRALGRVGAWHVIALQAAGRLHEPGTGQD